MKATTKRFHARPLAAALVASLGLGAHAADAFAATRIPVTTIDDAGTNATCTLRQAIVAMNASGVTTGSACVASTISGVDTITFDTTAFPPNGTNTITLADTANNQLHITDTNLVIDASANGNVTVQRSTTATNAFGIIYAMTSGGTLTIDHLTIANGKLTASQPLGAALGAGIASMYTSLVLNNSTVTGNSISTANYGAGGGVAVYTGDLTMTGSTISNNAASGYSGASGHGGGVFVRPNLYSHVGGNATISHSTITGNVAKGNGGGLHVGAKLTMTDSLVSGNTTRQNGGGIKLYGISTLTRSTISDNIATSGNGGGIIAASGYYGVPPALLTLDSSTMSGNQTTANSGKGGGIYSRTGNLAFVNSTIANNSASGAFGYGGGMFVSQNSQPITMRQTTVATNLAGSRGGGLMIATSDTGTVTFDGTLLANTGMPSTGGGNIAVSTGSITIAGAGNLEFSGMAGDVNATFATAPLTGDPQLGTLANNGGPTQTILPNSGSAAVNAIDCSNAPPVDQRGMIRPDPASGALTTPCDIGAVEVGSISDVIFANGFDP